MKEIVQVYILKTLQALKAAIPNGNHNFQLGDDGRLWLWVMLGEKWQSIIFDENYEDIEPEKLVSDIIEMLKNGGYKI